MFSRNSSKLNINIINTNSQPIEEIFNLINNNKKDKIIEYINDPNFKIWELKDKNGYTILHKSCFSNNNELSITIIQEVKKRLGKASSISRFIDQKNNEGLTALLYVAYKGNIELAKYLIKNGASVNSISNLGKNVIHFSAEGDQPSMMIYFLYKQGLDLYSVDENGSTALHWACYSGAENSVKFLIGLGIDVNAQDKENLTPLHLAALYNREKIVISLLKNGADKNLPNSRGHLPIDIARKKNFNNLINILQDQDYNPLCTLEPPIYYIKPRNIYKILIFVMIILPEIIIIIMILPFLQNIIDIIVNNILFLIDILLYIILLLKDPGYKKNNTLILDNESELLNGNEYPLLKLIEKKIDIKHHCPKCFIPETLNIKHCTICDKCVLGFSHHCFWLNKCIGKNNNICYILFIFLSLIFSLHSLFICIISLIDYANMPYERLIYFLISKYCRKRELRVLSSVLVGIFSLIISLPMTFLFFIQIIKFCHKNTYSNGKNNREQQSDISEEGLELEIRNKNNQNLINNNDNNKKEDILGINRESNEEKEIIHSVNSDTNIPIPQTPFTVDNNHLEEFDEE